MAAKFKAIVQGDVPANRLMVLGGRTDEGVIKVSVADNTAAADFVSNRALTDGEETEVTLKDGVNIWEVVAHADMVTGTWVVCREGGTVGQRSGTFGEHTEEIGFTIEPAVAGEVVKVVRRESLANGFSADLVSKVGELESRIEALEGGV